MKRALYTPEEKSKLVLEVFRGERTINELASEHNVHPNMLSRWKRDAETNLQQIFEDGAAKRRKEEKAHAAEVEALYAEIGRLTTENQWLKKKLVSECSVEERRQMVDMDGRELSVTRQAELLELNRSGLYYKPPGVRLSSDRYLAEQGKRLDHESQSGISAYAGNGNSSCLSAAEYEQVKSRKSNLPLSAERLAYYPSQSCLVY